MDKPIETLGEYDFTYGDDGEKLRLRGMSKRQREVFLSGRFLFLNKQMSQLTVDYGNLINLSAIPGQKILTYEEMTERYLKFYNDFLPVIEMIGVGDTLEVFKEWNEIGYTMLLANLLFRIVHAETSLAQGEDVPEEAALPSDEQIDAMSAPELEKLGEGSPPNGSVTTTSPLSRPAATSSSGARSGRAKRPKTSATSPTGQ